MKEIDFSKVPVKEGIASEKVFFMDMREGFADVIYTKCNGIAAHALAYKIFRSTGAEEYDDKECSIIRAVAEGCTPQVLDSISNVLKEKV